MGPYRVLVAHASKRGSTTEIAEVIGATLRDAGLDVEVRRAGDVTDVGPYDAVVLGSALYMARWQRTARRFARRHGTALRQRAVWLFSSGPLDGSADVGDLPATKEVAGIVDRLGARGHVTFGGRLEAGAQGFVASRMVANGAAGDFRDLDQIRRWAGAVAEELVAAGAG